MSAPGHNSPPSPAEDRPRRALAWLTPSRDRLAGLSLSRAGLSLFGGNLFFAALGYAQVAMVAVVIGVSRQYDLYLLAWVLPELCLFGLGNILQMHMVPGLHRVEHGQDEQQYWRAVWALIIWVGGGQTLVLAAAGWAARPIVSLVAPTIGPAELDQAVFYFRLLLVTAWIMGLVKLLGNLHQAGHSLWLNALAQSAAPIMVLAVLWLRPDWGVWGLWLGVTVGAAIQALVLVPALVGWGLLRHPPAWHHPLIKDLGRNLLYLIFITVGLRMLLAGDRVLASTLEAGTVSVLRYAMFIILAAVSLGVMPLLSVFFNRLSYLASRADWDQSAELLLKALAIFWLPLLPLAVFLGLFAEPLVDIALGRGSFSADSVAQTGRVLRAFAPLLPLAGWYFVALAAHTTRRSYGWPFVLGVILPALNLGLGWLLASWAGMNGVALVTNLCLIVWVVLLLWRPVTQAGREKLLTLARDLGRAAAGPLLAGLVVWVLRAFQAAPIGLWSQVGFMALFAVLTLGAMFILNRRQLIGSLDFLRQCKVAK